MCDLPSTDPQSFYFLLLSTSWVFVHEPNVIIEVVMLWIDVPISLLLKKKKEKQQQKKQNSVCDKWGYLKNILHFIGPKCCYAETSSTPSSTDNTSG